MKLKNLYNEIKLVPSNRILLQRGDEEDNHYYFKAYNTEFGVLKSELLDGIVDWNFLTNISTLMNLTRFLDSKKIPYEIIKKNYPTFYITNISVDAKHFVAPDKLNEIKLIKATKNPYLNKLLMNKELEERFKFYLEIDYFESTIHDWVTAQSFFGFYDWKPQDEVYFNWKSQFKDITKEQIIEIINYYKDKVDHHEN